MIRSIVKTAFINSTLSAFYIVAIASLLFYAPKTLGSEQNALIPMVMLSLLVFSVALMGMLIFGKPVMWYLDGRKDEALSLIAYTLAIFLGFIIVLLLILSFV
jgi:hypothetical protein